MKFQEYDTVALTVDVTSEGLKAGELGTILETREHPELYLVEFIHEDDDPLFPLVPEQLRLVQRQLYKVDA